MVLCTLQVGRIQDERESVAFASSLQGERGEGSPLP